MQGDCLEMMKQLHLFLHLQPRLFNLQEDFYFSKFYNHLINFKMKDSNFIA